MYQLLSNHAFYYNEINRFVIFAIFFLKFANKRVN